MYEKTVWVIQTGEPIHTDRGVPRAMRGMSTCDALVRNGIRTVFITAAFDHFSKEHRTRSVCRIFLPSGLEVVLLPSPGYRRNIGFRRLLDHAVMARHCSKEMARRTAPSAAFVGYPPIEVAWSAARYFRQNRVPFIIDVKDQWPSIFVDALPRRLRWIGRVLFRPYFRMARFVLGAASGLSAMSGSFLDWALSFAERSENDQDFVAPFTRPMTRYREATQQAEQSKIVLFLATNIESSSYDLSGVKQACERLGSLDAETRFMVTGVKPSPGFVDQVIGMSLNVEFTGMLDSDEISNLLRRAFCTVAPYARTDAFERSIPNKVVESLAHGIPVITTLRGEVENLIGRQGCGLVYDPSDPTSLSAVLESLVTNAEMYNGLRGGADHASLLFDHDRNYDVLTSRLESLASRRVSSRNANERSEQ